LARSQRELAPPKTGTDVLAFSSVREASLDAERSRLQQAGSGASVQLQAAQTQIDALKEDLGRASAEAEQWMSEFEDADERAQMLEQQLRGAQYRNQQLLAQIKARGEEPDSEVSLPSEWTGFADWCDDVLSGRVTLASRARRDVKSALFEDPQLAARCLLWLANEYRDSRLNGSSGDLRKALENGIYNDRVGGDSFEFKWNSRNVPVRWHRQERGQYARSATVPAHLLLLG
jgi:hypothetical protein